MRGVRVSVIAAVVLVAGCHGPAGAPRTAADSSPTPKVSATLRSFPGLPAGAAGRFHPDLSDLGGRSNSELSRVLPSADGEPVAGMTGQALVFAESGFDLALPSETEGEARPRQCLYAPFVKGYAATDDGSDWNVYPAATTSYSGSDGRFIWATVNRLRLGADLFALTSAWIAGCGTYVTAFPSFVKPEFADRRRTDTFGSGPIVSGVATYRYTSVAGPVPDAASSLDELPYGTSTTVLARVRSVLLTVRTSGAVDPGVLESLLSEMITRVQGLPG